MREMAQGRLKEGVSEAASLRSLLPLLVVEPRYGAIPDPPPYVAREVHGRSCPDKVQDTGR